MTLNPLTLDPPTLNPLTLDPPTLNPPTLDPPEPSAPAGREGPARPARASERVAAVLSDRIRSGGYGAGDLLPTERALADDLGVHRRSVRAAIDRLVQDGLVSRRPNCRPRVGGPPPSEPARAGAAAPAPSRLSASNLIALLMWHGGGPLEHAGTSQQRIFWGMNEALKARGYHAVFLDLGGRIGSEEENAAREAEHLRYVRDQGFGGALFYPYAYRHNHDLVREVGRRVPLVLLDRRIEGVEADFVGIQNLEAQAEITRHLIARGHRRIAHVTRGEPVRSVRDRVQGYLDAMRGAGEAGVSEMILDLPAYGDADERTWTLVDAAFGLPDGLRPTAAACYTDYMAVSLAERLARRGLAVPRDVALTGFDDIVPTLPDGLGLTTAAQPYEEIGIRAVELLLRRAADRHAPPASVELPARLIVRASSGPPESAA